ncbi:MAG: FAD-dependent oxidoreductase [Desulfobacteraceae bacterium]
MGETTCDLLVIGGGPGGYTAAITGAQKGLQVLLVERETIGGICLNRGCLPTKTLLENSRIIAMVQNAPFLKGDIRINRSRLVERTQTVVEGAVAGIAATLKENGVVILQGEAAFIGPMRVQVTGQNGSTTDIVPRWIVLATGSEPKPVSGIEPDGRWVLNTDQALMLDRVPATLAVVGAGGRGVEFASLFANLGTRVHLVEQEKRLLPREDRRISSRYRTVIGSRGIRVHTKTRALGLEHRNAGGIQLHLRTNAGQEALEVERVLLIGSRKPSFCGLMPETGGLRVEDEMLYYDKGTNRFAPEIYGVGDLCGPPYAAHKAISQALAAVEHMTDGHSPAPGPVPNCVYGDPEVASVGHSEDQAKKAGFHVKTGEFYFAASGRAATVGRDEGVLYAVFEEKSGALLGAHVLGPCATEVIGLAVMAIQNGLDLDHLKRTVLPHLTFSEVFFEAARSADREAIHLFLSE